MESEYRIQQILERYEIRLHMMSHFTEMKNIDLNTDFISVLMKLFEDETGFTEKEFGRFSLDVILDYITRTHRYYLTKKLPEMEQSVELLLQDYSGDHPLLILLRQFYTEYREHLTGHIQAEEKLLLPHVKFLIETTAKKFDAVSFYSRTRNYSLQKCIEAHSDTEEDLHQVREAIQRYTPPATNQTPYRVLLTQLQLFEKDLSIHALIEDRILIPRALAMEAALLQQLDFIARLN